MMSHTIKDVLDMPMMVMIVLTLMKTKACMKIAINKFLVHPLE
jgi:hypothetical protein